jgi:hypothetical protein
VSNRRGVVETVPFALCEELTCADLGLLLRRSLQNFRPVSGLRLLEGIAPRVIVEGLLVAAEVFIGLTQREAQVIPVCQGNAGRLDLLTHNRDLRFREPVGLEIREAPVSVAETGAMPRSFFVLMLGLGANALCLQCVPEVHMQVGVVRMLAQQFAVQVDGLGRGSLADHDAGKRATMGDVIRLCPHQNCQLFPCPDVLVGCQQRSNQVLACRVIAWILRQHFFEDYRRVLGEFVPLRNQCKDAQAFDVLWRTLYVRSDQGLRLGQVAVREHAARRDDFDREGGKLGDVLRGVHGL